MMNSRFRRFFIVLAACAVLAACQSWGNKSPSPSALLSYNITLLVEKGSNLSREGKELPLKVNIFKLKSPTEFMSADFYSLQNGDTVLKDKLLGQEQFFLHPGQREISLRLERTSELSHLGILAEYQQLDGKIWRRAVLLPKPVPVRRPFYSFLMPEKPAVQSANILVRFTSKGVLASVDPVRSR